MKRGLVIGKFLPLHCGHIALIEFAAQQCDEVIVSMSYTTEDLIDPEMRFEWIRQIFQNRLNIKPASIEDNFDNPDLPLTARTKIWADIMKKVYPHIDFVFSSEEYGESFAKDLNAKHIPFDADRKKFPVSASLIRNEPFNYWSFIPDVVKPYFVKKICFYGPESTGKSFMAKRMAKKYGTEFVPEVAREMIDSNNFNREDIIAIGREQTARVFQKTRTANKILFCDTDVITTQIYSKHYLKDVPPELYEFENSIQYDRYFLFDIDVPWVSDGLRDQGEEGKRRIMYEVFKSELDRRCINYIVVKGSWSEREAIITHAIDALLK